VEFVNIVLADLVAFHARALTGSIQKKAERNASARRRPGPTLRAIFAEAS
jgi:hypothetical protein